MNQWSDVILKSEMEIQGAPMKINLTQGYKKPNNFYEYESKNVRRITRNEI